MEEAKEKIGIEKLKEKFPNLKIVKGEAWFWKGYQKWGSGGYTAGFKILYGEAKIEKVGEKETSFICSIRYKLTPLSEFILVDGTHYDCVGREGDIRRFEGDGLFLILRNDILVSEEIIHKIEKCL